MKVKSIRNMCIYHNQEKRWGFEVEILFNLWYSKRHPDQSAHSSWNLRYGRCWVEYLQQALESKLWVALLQFVPCDRRNITQSHLFQHLIEFYIIILVLRRLQETQNSLSSWLPKFSRLLSTFLTILVVSPKIIPLNLS